MTASGEPEVQGIACLSCLVSDLVHSTDDRATKWPAWEPGLHVAFCPKCGGDAWAAEPILESEYLALQAEA